MILLDTHVWIWWLNDPTVLSETAIRTIQQAREQQAIYLSSISTWELALLVAKRRLELTIPVRDWLRKTEGLPFVHFLPVDNTIALRSVSLPGTFHPDPADRIITATAMTMGFSLLTRDEKILSYPHIRTIAA